MEEMTIETHEKVKFFKKKIRGAIASIKWFCHDQGNFYEYLGDEALPKLEESLRMIDGAFYEAYMEGYESREKEVGELKLLMRILLNNASAGWHYSNPNIVKRVEEILEAK
jgi:hypothetical protein